jgi:hypothetical protein
MEEEFEQIHKLHAGIFREGLIDSVTLAEVGIGVIEILKSLKDSGEGRIGFVSGIITSDGEKFIGLNLRRLASYTEFIRKANDFPIFSATDVFDEALTMRIGHNAEERWLSFWKSILHSGHITDLFMTPRWKESRGARDEYKAGKEIGMRIQDMGDLPDLMAIMNSHR